MSSARRSNSRFEWMRAETRQRLRDRIEIGWEQTETATRMWTRWSELADSEAIKQKVLSAELRARLIK